MPNWTPEELAIVQMRISANLKRSYPPKFKEDEPEPDLGLESELASKIVAHATGQGWPHIYFPQTKKLRNFLPPGFPDFVIAIPGGRTIYLETKAATRKLGKKQRLMCNMFRMLGHEYYKCKSFKRWLDIVAKRGGW